MTLLGLSTNRYGTPISVHKCNTCGCAFTVCPAVGEKGWGSCLAETCASYDEKRDVDKLFDEAPWKIGREGKP